MEDKKSTCIVIPARYNSSRLQAKALIDLGGLSMINRVYNQAKKATLADDVLVATDHKLILDHCKSKGIEVILTSQDHKSGTERLCEVQKHLNFDYYINVQGDEPLIDPRQIDDLIGYLRNNPSAQIVTQRSKIKDAASLFDFNVVKVVVNQTKKALYFSRSAIPSFRDHPFKFWINHHTYFKHLGIYGFRSDILAQIANLGDSRLEEVEKLEQLKWMDYGFDIQCLETDYQSIGVDTIEDVEKVMYILNSNEGRLNTEVSR